MLHVLSSLLYVCCTFCHHYYVHVLHIQYIRHRICHHHRKHMLYDLSLLHMCVSYTTLYTALDMMKQRYVNLTSKWLRSIILTRTLKDVTYLKQSIKHTSFCAQDRPKCVKVLILKGLYSSSLLNLFCINDILIVSLCVCVCVCMCVCVICVYLCTCACYVCVCDCVSLCVCLCSMCVSVYVRMVCMCVIVCVSMCICTHVV